MKELYDESIKSGNQTVVWAADERYVRELERWFRDNTRYAIQRNRQIEYLLDIIDTLKESTENVAVVPDDP